MRSLMRCDSDEHRQPPRCPDGHGLMVLTPQEEAAVFRRMTGYNDRGMATCLGQIIMPTAYGLGGRPLTG